MTVMAEKSTGWRNITYRCTECGRTVGRENLVVKRVVFYSMGQKAKILRSRTVGWLCTTRQDDGSPSCRDNDAVYGSPELGGKSLIERIDEPQAEPGETS